MSCEPFLGCAGRYRDFLMVTAVVATEGLRQRLANGQESQFSLVQSSDGHTVSMCHTGTKIQPNTPWIRPAPSLSDYSRQNESIDCICGPA